MCNKGMEPSKTRALLLAAAVGALPSAYTACELASSFSTKAIYFANGPASSLNGDATEPTCSVAQTTIDHSPDAGSDNPNPDSIFFVDQTLHPDAMCNDGSAPAFMVRQGVGSARDRWIVFLDGGGFCATLEDCAPRVAHGDGNWVSSDPLREPVAIGPRTGVLDPAKSGNPDFFDASVLRIFYCSSDFHYGRHRGTGPFSDLSLNSWSFMGNANLKAILAHAMAEHGLDEAKEVLLMGTSAGAIGALLNANEVKRLLPPATRFLAAADSGLPIRYPDFDQEQGRATNPPVYSGDQKLIDALAVWQPSLDARCLALAQKQGMGEHVCLSSAFFVSQPIMTVPSLLVHSLTDTTFLGHLGVPMSASASPGMVAYVGAYANEMRGFLSSVQPLHSAFGIDDPFHTIFHKPRFSSEAFSVGGSAYRVSDRLKSWYERPCPALSLIQ